MKAIFFPVHTKTDNLCGIFLELVQRHVDDGDEVLVILPDVKRLPLDGARLTRDTPIERWEAQKRLDSVIRQLPAAVEVRNFDDFLPADCDRIETSEETIAELKQRRIDDFDFGYAVLSSFAWMIRDPESKLSHRRKLLDQLANESYQVYRVFQRVLDEEPQAVYYTFNGRFGVCRPLLRLCQQKGIECRLWEVGCDKDHFMVYRDRMLHEIDYYAERIESHWNGQADEVKKRQAAEDFFEGRRSRKNAGKVYAAKQDLGALPEGWNPDRHNIVVFTSSEDEKVSLNSEWDRMIFPTQYGGLKFLENSLKHLEADVEIWVRLHPNLTSVSYESLEQMRKMGSERFHIIRENSPIDSYALLNAADKVAVFGSTMGPEAVYAGKPVLSLRSAYYTNLDLAYNIETEEELLKLLKDRDLATTDHQFEQTLKWGYYWQTFGEPFKYYEASKWREGRFRGQPINRSPALHQKLLQLEDLFFGFLRKNLKVYRPIAWPSIDKTVAVKEN